MELRQYQEQSLADLWAHRSAGKCLFVMPNGPDWGAIEKAIGSR